MLCVQWLYCLLIYELAIQCNKEINCTRKHIIPFDFAAILFVLIKPELCYTKDKRLDSQPIVARDILTSLLGFTKTNSWKYMQPTSQLLFITLLGLVKILLLTFLWNLCFLIVLNKQLQLGIDLKCYCGVSHQRPTSNHNFQELMKMNQFYHPLSMTNILAYILVLSFT